MKYLRASGALLPLANTVVLVNSDGNLALVSQGMNMPLPLNTPSDDKEVRYREAKKVLDAITDFAKDTKSSHTVLTLDKFINKERKDSGIIKP